MSKFIYNDSKLIRQNGKVGDIYFKLIVRAFDLAGSDQPLKTASDYENWGYMKNCDIEDVIDEFNEEIDASLDGCLDYGYMEIIPFEIIEKEGRKVGLKKIDDIIVNDCGTWRSLDEFASLLARC